MLGYRIVEGLFELPSLTAAKCEEILGLPASLSTIGLDAVAFEPRISPGPFAMKGHASRCIERRELAYELFKTTMLAAVMRADGSEVDHR